MPDNIVHNYFWNFLKVAKVFFASFPSVTLEYNTHFASSHF